MSRSELCPNGNVPDAGTGFSWAQLYLVHFIVYNMVMIRVNIHQAKTQLSRYLRRLAKGETILLCKRNTPVAELRPLPALRTRKRPIGLDKGKFVVPPEFFEPLPAGLLALFNGEETPPSS